jgi:CDP-diacylglycerol--serine O-phosphatidyltransferase
MAKTNNTQNKIPFSNLAPSLITLIALCLGITSIRYALDFKWEVACALIIVAGFLDGIDGRIARLFNSTSDFGAQLDSLADIVSFGVAPAVVIYLWSLHEIPYKGVGWAVVLFFIGCAAIRLARYNAASSDPEEQEKLNHHFTGVPMPAAAGIGILPLVLTFEIAPNISISPWFSAGYMLIIGALMISRIPTFSLKKISINREYLPIFMLLVCILFTTIIIEPWFILPLLGLTYISTLPFSLIKHLRKERT